MYPKNLIWNNAYFDFSTNFNWQNNINPTQITNTSILYTEH